jgi:hypothetical protein
MCDLNSIEEYFDDLSFGDQLELLGSLASRLKQVSNSPGNEPTNNEIQAAYNALGGSCGCGARRGGGRSRKVRRQGNKRRLTRHR